MEKHAHLTKAIQSGAKYLGSEGKPYKFDGRHWWLFNESFEWEKSEPPNTMTSINGESKDHIEVLRDLAVEAGSLRGDLNRFADHLARRNIVLQDARIADIVVGMREAAGEQS